MKTLILGLVTTLLACFSARADFLVYKQKLKETSTGGGEIFKQKISGWLVLNTDDGEIVEVDVFDARGRFSIYYWADFAPDYSIDTVSAGLGNESLVFSFAQSYLDEDDAGHVESATMKGKNTTLTPATEDWAAPKSMSLVGAFIYQGADESYLTEYKGRYVYDATTSGNLSSLYNGDLNSAVGSLADDLVAKGYTEE